jgi:SAM-dependent methyltransferase
MINQYRRSSYETSQAIAPGWERRRPQLETAMTPVREWMAGELAAPPGATILELAAGAGDTGFDVAKTLGADGHLLCTDFSPAMVEVARRRAGELGLANVEFAVMDAEQLDLETDSVDGVLCRLGFMLMVDPAAALSETRRVLRPGGRLALAVWGAPERNPFFTVLAATLVTAGHMAPPADGAPIPWSMSSEEHTRARLEAAGFDSVVVDGLPVEFRFRDTDDYLGFMADTAGPLAVVLQQLSHKDRETVAAAIADGFSPFATDGQYTLPGAVLVAAAS